MYSEVVDLSHVRLERQAPGFAFCQVAALMKLFWLTHLRFASNVSELVEWARAMFPAGVEIDPSTVLSEGEMSAATADSFQEIAGLIAEHVLSQINVRI